MSKFNLNDFDEERLLKKSKKKKIKARPKWLKTANTRQKQLYDLVSYEFKNIKKAIKMGTALSINQRKIKIAVIAEKAGVTRGYITPQKTEEIYELIKKHNNTLSKIWAVYGNDGSKRNLTKSELTKKLSKCKKELKSLIDERTSETITELLKTSLSETKQNLVKQLSDLQHKYDELFEKSNLLGIQVQNATSTNIRLSKEKMKLLRQNKKLQKELMKLKSN